MIFLLVYFWINLQGESRINLPYSELKSELTKDNVVNLVQRGEKLSGELRTPREDQELGKRFTQFYSIVPGFADDEFLQLIKKHKVRFEAVSTQPSIWVNLFINLIPWLLIIAFFIYTTKVFRNSLGSTGRNGLFNFAKSKAKHYDASNIKQRYADVAGLDNAKRELQEIIDYLKSPNKYRQLGAKIPKGILLMGPPGCGKTLLAKATAGEAAVPFFSVSASEFIEMYVGVGASRVRDMFQSARKEAPALIFIDEIDSIGRIRGTGLGGGHDEREQTLNQILSEMDGFSTHEAVVVLAATNRPDILDPALLRPGRFDRKLVLELPQRQARLAILQVHCQDKPLAKDIDLDIIAAGTAGFSGADLANLVNEAALGAARAKQSSIKQLNFTNARDKVALGNESGELLTGEEKERVAYHECGHAMLALLLPKVDPLNKISIIPRGRALGITEQTPIEDRHNYTQSYLQNRLCILLGGRCAEQLIYSEVSSGAADDLRKATELARHMVSEWGMNEKIGAMNLQQGENHPFLGKEMTSPRKFSEEYAKKVDDEVAKLLTETEQKAQELLMENRLSLETLAKALIEQETLNRDQIVGLLPDLTHL